MITLYESLDQCARYDLRICDIDQALGQDGQILEMFLVSVFMEQDQLSHDRGQEYGTARGQTSCAPTFAINLRQKLKTEAKYLKITQAKSNM